MRTDFKDNPAMSPKLYKYFDHYQNTVNYDYGIKSSIDDGKRVHKCKAWGSKVLCLNKVLEKIWTRVVLAKEQRCVKKLFTGQHWRLGSTGLKNKQINNQNNKVLVQTLKLVGIRKIIYFKKALKKFRKARHYVVYKTSHLDWSSPKSCISKRFPHCYRNILEKKKKEKKQ